MTFRIGILSDTHGLLRPEAERRLAGVDHIIHGGDIGRPDIIDALRRIAPVTAIKGNVDTGDWARENPDTELLRLERFRAKWTPVRVKQTCQDKKSDPGFDSIETEKAPANRSIFIVHDLKTLQIDPVALGIDVVVSGHSHVPRVETVGGVLYVNPGSAGRRRFKLPITLATLDVTPEGLRAAIHDIG